VTTLILVSFASFAGSFHCVGMCGPFVGYYSVQSDRRTWVRHLVYHLGRLVAYVTLGAVVGALGRGILFLGGTLRVQKGLAIAMGISMIGAGLMSLTVRGKRPLSGLQARLQGLLARLHLVPGQVQTAALIGLFSTLLPCGYLYSFVLAAGTTASAWHGVLVMFAFWLGTVPALLGVGFLTGFAPRKFLRRVALAAPLFMIVFGCLAISGKWVGIPDLGSDQLCHQFPAWSATD